MTAGKIYLMMNKPCGYVCSAVSDSHKTVYELLSPELQQLVQGAKRGERLHTVGRLDCDTSGLLLFTNDGMFSHKIAATAVPEALEGPHKNAIILKTYLATLKNQVPQDLQTSYITRAAQGLMLPPEKKAPEQKAAPSELTFINETNCRITITEGKFHEVRRIFLALGNEVTALKRIAIGNLELPQDLAPGQYKSFTPEQILF